MTTTYLALTKGSAATDDTHRQIILTALLHNSSDGIVKDDSGFDPSLAAILACGDGQPYALAIVLRQGLQREAGEH